MDPYDTDPRPKPVFVGKAPQKQHQHRLNPAWRLAGSNHPYAPFTGNALKWESYVYDDASTYEGLMKLNIPHNVGTVWFGKLGACGVPRTQHGDRYEGDFEGGYVHGMGQFSGKNGKIYQGEWAASRRHGCGMEEDITPFRERVKAGEDAETAWKNAEPIIRSRRKYGTWIADRFVSPPDASGHYCTLPEILGVLEETEHVVAKARMFQYKPDGEVTLRMMQDKHGAPLPLMQDPLHYPHGTGFLAPGPAGQCFALPDDPQLQDKMARALHNAEHVYERHNLDYDFIPGSPLAHGFKLWTMQRRRFRRLNEGREAAKALEQRARAARWAVKGRRGGATPDLLETQAALVRTAEAKRGEEAGPRREHGALASLTTSVGRGLWARLSVPGSFDFHRRTLARPTRRQPTSDH